jgi:hypothetical protein
VKPYAIVLGLLTTACANAGTPNASGDDQVQIDAPSARIDAPSARIDAPADPVDAPHVTPIDAPPAPTAKTLLLSEVMLAPSPQEFIEIVNPTTAAVTLTDYYLADRSDYYKLPVGGLTNTASDFIAQFPAGATIPPNGVVTVALGSAMGFQNATNVAPTYSIADGTMIKTLVGSTAGLTDGGEIVVLFNWNGTDPLVKDVDMLIAGVPTAGNSLVDKSGVTQGAGTYAHDLNTITAQGGAPGAGLSTKRIKLETGNETQAGTGNGITGDDETSEKTTVTWDSAFTGPTPGMVPAALTP